MFIYTLIQVIVLLFSTDLGFQVELMGFRPVYLR